MFFNVDLPFGVCFCFVPQCSFAASSSFSPCGIRLSQACCSFAFGLTSLRTHLVVDRKETHPSERSQVTGGRLCGFSP